MNSPSIRRKWIINARISNCINGFHLQISIRFIPTRRTYQMCTVSFIVWLTLGSRLRCFFFGCCCNNSLSSANTGFADHVYREQKKKKFVWRMSFVFDIFFFFICSHRNWATSIACKHLIC